MPSSQTVQQLQAHSLQPDRLKTEILLCWPLARPVEVGGSFLRLFRFRMVPMLSSRHMLGSWCALACLVISGTARGQDLTLRQPLDPGPVRAAVLLQELPAEITLKHRLVVKFVDQARVRSDADGGIAGASDVDLSAVRELAAAHGLTFAPLIRLPRTTLTALEQRAAEQSGKAQPDLAGMLIVTVPEADAIRLEVIGQALHDLVAVEFATIQTLGNPPPGDIQPVTPDLSGNQLYAGPNPGINSETGITINLNGLGIRLSDCEYGWNPDHEDLNDLDTHPEPGQTIDPAVFALGFDSHGTAVVGETSAVSNGYGCTGLIPDADLYTYPEWSVEEGTRRVTAITNAIAGSTKGDVVLLEMQTVGMGGDFGPAELDPSVFVVVRAGVDAGIVVVGAAGNGDQDLDGAAYSDYANMGSSGAILVGAGSADLDHDKLSFSTYGSRVDLQGWGEDVFTLGYGDFAEYGLDKKQRYTSVFNGTSSASPMVAAACVMVQQKAISSSGGPLDPSAVRQILITTGTAQGSGGHIGPLPNVSKAIQALSVISPHPWVFIPAGVGGTAGVPALATTGTLLGSTDYTLNVSSARPVASSYWVLGLSAVNLPFKGGTLVPAPDFIIGPFLTSFAGVLNLSGVFPPGVPVGFSFFSQFWIVDPVGVQGFAATNGVKGTAQ